MFEARITAFFPSILGVVERIIYPQLSAPILSPSRAITKPFAESPILRKMNDPPCLGKDAG
jgi:hypothetical protein